jgi:hypothetical protein
MKLLLLYQDRELVNAFPLSDKIRLNTEDYREIVSEFARSYERRQESG